MLSLEYNARCWDRRWRKTKGESLVISGRVLFYDAWTTLMYLQKVLVLCQDRRIFCWGFHHTCSSLLHTVYTDMAPVSPKTRNPDTTILCALLMSPFKTTQASPLGHICKWIQSSYICTETSRILHLTCKPCPKSAPASFSGLSYLNDPETLQVQRERECDTAGLRHTWQGQAWSQPAPCRQGSQPCSQPKQLSQLFL